ncbi:haloacid dehalogenase type II [Vibrio breoganii]|uniref:haloacid dehalogenase type II n=1 Tax=Vibrio breoganii TaxID=553239 RepID=UPI000C837F4D|nr:haloacid dehalogenase type II [Vibrio breoganii]PML92685.1 haloacid dehalogenase, type II [Vibrio breoganii]PMN59920.1 haloacid dehalogenase, type II [Vibrio breoganii]
MRDTVLFDINETVLSLAPLKPKFATYFGSADYTDTWFSMLLHSSTVAIVTGIKSDFATLAKIALQTLASKKQILLSEAQQTEILSTFANLPAHPDIKPALLWLRDNGYRTVALSNSSSKLITTQIENAGLTEYFDQVISVEETESFKPCTDVYHYAASKVERSVEDLRLVATHDWDTHGAITAGMRAAYINRSGALYHPLYKKAEVVADNMQQLVEQIVNIDNKLKA